MNKFLKDYKKIIEYRKNNIAPIDKYGIITFVKEKMNKNDRFKLLIGVLLASRTRDIVTYEVLNNLINYGLTTNKMEKINMNTLKSLIKKVNFYKTKAKQIKEISKILNKKYNGDIPNTLNGLMELPGIGLKIGTYIMQIAWNNIKGITVDSNIHRLANKMNWVNTKKPNETKKELEKIIPKKYWKNFNRIAIGYVQLGNL